MGEAGKAQEVLARAVAVSPHAVRRLRRLGETAFEAGDDDTAEKMLKQVVAKAKYSEFRDPEDHVKLVRTLVRKGDPVAAAAVIRDLERSMGGKGHADACSAISSALLHEYTGNDERLLQSLNAALAASRELPGMSADLKLELARSCLAHDMEEGAAAIVRDVMRNAADAGAMERAMGVMARAGHAELGTLLAQEARQHVIDLVAGGAERAKNGDYHGAVTLMREAAAAMPGNPQVAFNAALALLRCLEHTGWNDRLGQQAQAQMGAVRRLDPRNPKLAALTALHQAVLKKYDKGPRARKNG
jgi:thioredoxin-like negative regulator of GroEL